MPVSISFPLERNIIVSLIPAAILEPSDTQLDQVHNIKRHKQQLALLSRVDALMIDHKPVNPARIPRPKRPEQIHTNPLRHKPAFNYHNKQVL